MTDCSFWDGRWEPSGFTLPAMRRLPGRFQIFTHRNNTYYEPSRGEVPAVFSAEIEERRGRSDGSSSW
jgi:hypothetical protein